MNKEQAIKTLRRMLRPGKEIVTVVRHVSRSGMRRAISAQVAIGGQVRNISWQVATATGRRWDGDRAAVIVDGCGMDMGFELVYSLGAALWPKGDGRYVSGRNGDKTPEEDGGYLLRQRWG